MFKYFDRICSCFRYNVTLKKRPWTLPIDLRYYIKEIDVYRGRTRVNSFGTIQTFVRSGFKSLVSRRRYRGRSKGPRSDVFTRVFFFFF